MLNWKYIFAVSFFTFLLSIILYNDTFRTLDEGKINKRKYENCQSLIVGRFLAAENNQLFAFAGLPGQYNFNRTWGICSDTKNFEFYAKGQSTQKYQFEPYLSQIGGNGMVQEVIEKALPFSKSTNYDFLQFLQTFFLSLSVVLILFQFYRNFGWLTAVVPYVLLAFSTWFVYLAPNIWFSIWTYYFPFIFFWFYIEKNIRNDQKINLKKLLFWVIAILFLKIFFTGFEFITTILITTTIPLFYYYFYIDFHKNRKANIFKYIGVFIAGFLVVFVLNGIIMYLQINSLGSGSSAIEHIINRFEQRTQGTYHYNGENFAILEKLHLDVFVRYLGSSAFNFGFKFPFILPLLLYVVFSIFIWMKKRDDHKTMAFLYTSLISFLAPLSWFVIFREHSHVHTHLDFVIWYVPFMIFVFGIYGIAFQILIGSFSKSKK